MDKVRSNVHIPSVVGRLDPVVDAIRAEDWDKVRELVAEEKIRLRIKIANLVELVIKERWNVRQLDGFYDGTFDPRFCERVLEEANQ